MQDFYRELKKDPRRTIVDAFNMTHRRMIPYHEFVISDIVDKGKEASFTLAAAEGAVQVVSARTMTINRIDLAGFFTVNERRLVIPDCNSTNDILAALQSPHEFFYDNRDFMIEYIKPGATSYTLKAMADSLRWYGSVEITLASSLPGEAP